MRFFATVCFLLAMAGLGGCGRAGDKPLLVNGRATLTLPAKAAQGQGLVLRLKVGALPVRGTLVVYSAGGEIIGSASPFPPSANPVGGSYEFPIPAKLLTKDGLSLEIKLERSGAEPRIPLSSEVEALELAVDH